MTPMQTPNRSIVICGGGVIGAAAAYYLRQRGLAVRLIERDEIAGAASGKSGGFLAEDWCDDTPLEPLARLSFALHAELARTLQTDYGYRRLTTLAAAVVADGAPDAVRRGVPDWLDGHCVSASLLGDERTTAQVDPARFTRALLDAAGVPVLRGVVEDVVRSGGRVSGVRVDGCHVAAEAVVIAAGPWSARTAPGLALPEVYGLKGHSIVLRPSAPVPAQALFLDYAGAHGRLSPEVYPRPDGTVYLCGLSEDAPVPEQPQDVTPHPDAGRVLTTVAASLSSALAGLEPERVQACYRPVVADGLPLLGAVPGVAGAYVATGHSCWGILNAPASGLALAELIADGQAHSVDLAPFSPARLLRV